MKRFYSLLLSSTLVAGAMAAEAPKNIIFLIGDGMSYNTITATNYYNAGKDSVATFQSFPVTVGMSSFNGNPGLEYRSDLAWNGFDWVASKYTDSAAAATAFSTGKKTYNGAIGVDIEKVALTHFMTIAEEKGKATGVVSSVQFSHATPAAHIAHNEARGNYEEIATEMLNSDADVIIGAGHPNYDNDGVAVTKDATDRQYKYVGGKANWDALTAGELNDWTFVDDKERVAEIAAGKNLPAKLCVVAKAGSTLQQSRSAAVAGEKDAKPYAAPLNPSVNTLDVLSTAAMNVLAQDEDGFVLMIEGGAIDWANHANDASRMIEEQTDFNNTIDAVVAWVEKNGGWDQNLVVVSSDHETGYLLGPDAKTKQDNKPTTNPILNNGKGEMPALSYNSGNHTNMLTPVYAKGAGAELLADMAANRVDPIRGNYLDNTDIPKVFVNLWTEMPTAKTIKNVIYMVGDGMGRNAMDAANFYTASTQEYEEFPLNAYMSSFHAMQNVDDFEIDNYFPSYNSLDQWTIASYSPERPTDSAAAATAMGVGAKTYKGSINMSQEQIKLETLAEVALRKGRAAGVISSVQFSHATPAAFGGAHNISRNNYAEIANEMLSSNLQVLMGAGHPDFDNNGVAVTKDAADRQYKYVGGETTWNALTAGELNNWEFLDDKAQLEAIANGSVTDAPAKLCFVAQAATTIQQSRNTCSDQEVRLDSLNQSVPTLEAMTSAALNVLGKDEDGLFIMVEGGAIDWAGHANQKGRIIEEQIDFNNACQAAIDWVNANSNWDETLMIVTADHETGYLMNPAASGSNKVDGKYDFTQVNIIPEGEAVQYIVDNGEGQMPGMDFYSGGHTNMLVPFFAKGANSEWFNNRAGSWDMKRGYYVDNTEAARVVKTAWAAEADVDGIANEGYSPLFDNKELLVSVAGSELTLRTDLIEGDATAAIINANGTVIARSAINFANGIAQYAIDAPQGVYFIMVNQGAETLSAKVVMK